MPLAESFDHVGPMARTVADVAIMFDAIAGNDPLDPSSLRSGAAHLVRDLPLGVRGLRIGIDRDYAFTGVDRGEATSIEHSLKILSALGATIVDVRMPDMTGVTDSWYLLCAVEAVKAHAASFPSRATEYGPYFREFLEFGANASSDQLTRANKRRAEVTGTLITILASVDAVVCPGGGAPAVPITKDVQYGSMTAFNEALNATLRAESPPRRSATYFTVPMNFAGTPAICVPSGFSPEGLPYSVQFFSRHDGESVLCRIGFAYEQATNWHTRHPSVDNL
jgi:amidase